MKYLSDRRFSLLFRGFRFLLTLSLLSCLALSAQTTGANADATDLRHRIEKNVRAHFKVPNRVQIEVSQPRPSELNGYDAVTVTLISGEKRNPYEFFVSKDGKTLAQLNKLDVSQDPLDVAGRPSRGAADAKVTVIVWDDFQCPYCAIGYKTLFSDVLPQYQDRVRVVYKDFPLMEIHPWAVHAAVDANCLFAQSNDAYWDYAGYVHSNQKEIRGADQPLEKQLAALDASALDAGKKYKMDLPKLQACVKAQDDKAVQASAKYGEQALGIDATPTIYINGTKLDGAVPADELRSALNNALHEAGVAAPEIKSEAKPAASSPAAPPGVPTPAAAKDARPAEKPAASDPPKSR